MGSVSVGVRGGVFAVLRSAARGPPLKESTEERTILGEVVRGTRDGTGNTGVGVLPSCS